MRVVVALPKDLLAAAKEISRPSGFKAIPGNDKAWKVVTLCYLHRATRYYEAVLGLFERGMGAEAVPLCRSMYEIGLTAPTAGIGVVQVRRRPQLS